MTVTCNCSFTQVKTSEKVDFELSNSLFLGFSTKILLLKRGFSLKRFSQAQKTVLKEECLFLIKVPFFRKFDGAQKNMPNHYLTYHYLTFWDKSPLTQKRRSCEVAKNAQKFKQHVQDCEMAYLFEPANSTNRFLKSRPLVEGEQKKSLQPFCRLEAIS